MKRLDPRLPSKDSAVHERPETLAETAGAPAIARLAIGAVSAVVLLVQISATRLLSATVEYHAAFVVLALVMLSLAGSAAAVYRDQSRSNAVTKAMEPAARSAIAAGVLLAATGLLYVIVGAIPLPVTVSSGPYVCTALVGLFASFHACGYVVAWLLASWPSDVGRVYFADLLGAALGASLAVPVLGWVSPIQILVASGLVVMLAGLALGHGERGFVPRYAWIGGGLALATVMTFVAPSVVRLRFAKAQDQSSVLSEEWNQLARVTVIPEVPGTRRALELLQRQYAAAEAEAHVRAWTAGWAMSERWNGDVPRSLWIQLDADAGTQILEHGGTRPLGELDVLRWDVTSAAYWLRPNLNRAFIVGGGGGRDVLTALAFGAKAVDVVELNPLVIDAVQGRFGEFSGRPYTRAGVQYRLGDARSELSRSAQRYDLIQMSMIDTWAASTTGALTLSENALYTREAFQTYFDHLSDDGMLTISRWYAEERYGETARILSLMADVLEARAVDDPLRHVAVVISEGSYGTGVATCMLTRRAFTDADRNALVAVGQQTGFKLFWPEVPGVTVHQAMDVEGVLTQRAAVTTGGRYDLTAPSDDRPFFFNLVRLPYALAPEGAHTPLLFGMLVGAILLVGWFFVVEPLARIERLVPAGERFSIVAALPEVIYFAMLGAAFMGVELGVLQRYIVFLGHPTYALSVVLFSLLLSTAIGSFSFTRYSGWARLAFPLLVLALAVTTFVVPTLLRAWHGWPLAGRVTVAVLLIVPLGICMGTAFPSGVRALDRVGRARIMPWMWAINGLTGTFASVAGMFVAMELGYTTPLVFATAGYLIAWAVRSRFAAARDAHRPCDSPIVHMT